jgi:hypothetical protein
MFENKNLSVIAYANGFTLWHYSSQETLEELYKENYFKKIFDLAATGDIVILNGSDGAAIKVIKLKEVREVILTDLSK